MNVRLMTGIAAACVMAGCASTPMPNAALDHARMVVESAEANPDVARYSALDLDAAKKQLAAAESAELQRDETTTSQAAYMASQTARLAQLRATAKADDAHVADGQAERNRIQLEARTREVQQAQAAADLATAKTRALQSEAQALKSNQN